MTQETLDADDSALERIDKRTFIRMMAKEADVPLYVAAQTYEAFVKVLLDSVRAGNTVNLTGFGKFYWQRHGGHQVQFGAGQMHDYTVLKFSATRATNQFLDLEEDEALDKRVPGTRVKYSQSVGEKLSRRGTPGYDAAAVDDGDTGTGTDGAEGRGDTEAKDAN